MASASESLDDAIESWCGLKPIDYAPAAAFSGLWARTGNPMAYDSAGIESLITCIYRRPVFQDCEMPRVTVGMFQAGGGLQTKRDLFMHFENCG